MSGSGVIGVAIALCVLGWSGSAFGQTVPAPRGELRVVDHRPNNWVTITLNAFEHLMEFDGDGELARGTYTAATSPQASARSGGAQHEPPMDLSGSTVVLTFAGLIVPLKADAQAREKSRIGVRASALIPICTSKYFAKGCATGDASRARPSRSTTTTPRAGRSLFPSSPPTSPAVTSM